MSTLKRQEPVGAGLRRVACEELESAIRLLSREQGRAHAARDAVRRVDAVLGLAEQALPRPDVKRDRAILERLMPGLTELLGPADLLARLDRHYKKPPADESLARAVKALRKKRSPRRATGQAMNSRSGSFNPVIYRLVADMAELRGHAGAWALDALPNDAPPAGLRRSYARVRRFAAEPPTASDQLAALSDAAAQLAEQLGVLTKCCPTMLKPHRKLLARAAEALRDLEADRSLAHALREQMGKAKPPSLPGDDAPEQSSAIVAQQLTPALAESPAAFANRIKVYWQAWRTPAKPAPETRSS